MKRNRVRTTRKYTRFSALSSASQYVSRSEGQYPVSLLSYPILYRVRSEKRSQRRGGSRVKTWFFGTRFSGRSEKRDGGGVDLPARNSMRNVSLSLPEKGAAQALKAWVIVYKLLLLLILGHLCVFK